MALRRLAAGWVFGAGLLCGLAVLIKPEIILAAGGVMFGGIILLAWQDFRKPPWARWGRAAAIFVAGGFVPMILTTLMFHLGGRVLLHDALAYANNAWLGIIDHSNMASSEWQQRVMGTDQLGKNLWREFMWGGMAVAFGGGLALVLPQLFKLGTAQKVVSLVFLIAAVAFAVRYVPWTTGQGNYLYSQVHQLPGDEERLPDTFIGFALPGLLLCGALIEGWRLKNQADAVGQSVVRVLMIMAAAAWPLLPIFNTMALCRRRLRESSASRRCWRRCRNFSVSKVMPVAGTAPCFRSSCWVVPSPSRGIPGICMPSRPKWSAQIRF
jgi:hypothetical protein